MAKATVAEVGCERVGGVGESSSEIGRVGESGGSLGESSGEKEDKRWR